MENYWTMTGPGSRWLPTGLIAGYVNYLMAKQGGRWVVYPPYR